MKRKLAILGMGKHVLKNVLPNIAHLNDVFDFFLVHLLKNSWQEGDLKEMTYEELLLREDIEMVYNCLPNALHIPKTIEILAHQKHVLCEKPLGINFEEVKSAVNFSLEKKLILREAFMYQHHIQHPIILEKIKRMDSVRSIDLVFSYFLEDEKNIRFSKDLGGGIFNDAACYGLHFLRKLGFNVFDKIEVFKRMHPLKEVDVYYLILLFKKEMRVSIEVRMDGYREQACVIKGLNSMMRISHPFLTREGEKVTLTIHESGKQEVLKFYSNPVYHDQLRWFLKEVNEGKVEKNKELLEQAKFMDEIRNQAREIS